MGAQSYLIQLICLTLVYIYWSSAYNIIGGFAGHVSLGNATYIGLGAYTSVILYTYYGVSPWIGMFISGIIAALISAVIGFVTFRMRGSYYTLSTVALLTCFRIVFASSRTIFGIKTNGASGMKISWLGENFWGMQFESKIPFYYIFLSLAIICILICAYIKKSKMGYYLAAITTNQEAASSLGVGVMQYKVMALASSAFLTAVGGAVYAFFLTSIDPLAMFNYDVSARLMLLTVVGGVGTVWGPVLGATILIPLNEWMRAAFGSRLSGISFVFYGLILVLVVLFLSGGLVSLKDKFVKLFAGFKKKGKDSTDDKEVSNNE